MSEIAAGSVRAWILAARPATLTAAFAPVAVGTACAWRVDAFRCDAALAALTGANAFVAPQGPVASSTQLAMSDIYTSVRDNVDVGVGGPLAGGAGGRDLAEIWDNSSPVIVQGGSLRTWSFANPAIESVQVLLKTEGRPLDADVELWQGPDNTPHKMRGLYLLLS